MVDFYKIIILILKIQVTKEVFLVKTVHFSNKILYLNLKVKQKSNQSKVVKIRNQIQNNLAIKPNIKVIKTTSVNKINK